MSQKTIKTPGIFLIVEFDWPEQMTPELFKASGNLHQIFEKSDWAEERVAAYGGLRGEYQCYWIFRIQNYATLEKLLHPSEDQKSDESEAYANFFNKMARVKETVRQEVTFG